jgi:tripartite-type tricarboxylate transporter receptor subunit TctC
MLHRFAKAFCIPLAIASVLAWPAPASADAISDFYTDRVMKILVPFNPGGGFDAYSRVLSRHMPRHIPGHPPMVLQFMPGAGGLKGANYFYNVSPKDGSNLALLSQTAPLFQAIMGSRAGLRYDTSKLNYIGRLTTMEAAVMLWHKAPATSLAELRKTQVVACVAGKAHQGYINAKSIAVIAGLKLKIVTGYNSSRGQSLALERGECHMQIASWNSWLVRQPGWIRDRKVIPIALVGPDPVVGLEGVPLSRDLAKTDEHRQILEFIAGYAAVGRAFSVPPKVPKARIAALRKAFNATVKDPKFIAEAKKRNMILNPAPGEFIQKVVQRTINAPQAIIAKTKAILGFK